MLPPKLKDALCTEVSNFDSQHLHNGGARRVTLNITDDALELQQKEISKFATFCNQILDVSMESKPKNLMAATYSPGESDTRLEGSFVSPMERKGNSVPTPSHWYVLSPSANPRGWNGERPIPRHVYSNDK